MPVTKDEFLNNLMVVLTIYRRTIEQSEAFNSLTAALQQFNISTTLFVYDNSPESQTIGDHPNWLIHYQHDPNNSGVSKAYNQGFDKAFEQHKHWLLLADQDTLFPPDAFEKYFESLTHTSSKIIVPLLKDNQGILSPHTFGWGSGKRTRTLKGQLVLNINEYFFINSGLMISLEAFGKTLYDENLPLDFSDFAFVQRLRKYYSSFYLMNLSCDHHLSANEKITLDQKLQRFRSYLKASKHYKANYSQKDWRIGVRNLFRAMKLSLHYRSFQFVAHYLRSL